MWMLDAEISDRFVVVGVLMCSGWVGCGGGGGGEGRGSVGWSCQNKGILKISKTKQKDISKYQKAPSRLRYWLLLPFPSTVCRKVCDIVRRSVEILWYRDL